MEYSVKDDGSVLTLLGRRFEKKLHASMERHELIAALRAENHSLRGKSDDYISDLIDRYE